MKLHHTKFKSLDWNRSFVSVWETHDYSLETFTYFITTDMCTHTIDIIIQIDFYSYLLDKFLYGFLLVSISSHFSERKL